MESLTKELGKLTLSKARVGIIYDFDMNLHSPNEYHPERPERLKSIIDHLRSTKLFNKCEVITSITKNESSNINLIHSQAYLNYVEQLCSKYKPGKGEGDTYYNKHTSKAANLAVNAVCECVDKVITESWNAAFAIIRPPGHHANAENDKCLNGFCIFNNVAIAAKYAQKKFNLKRILILDWDVHHGDSTQKFFYEDESVLYISIHRYDKGTFYPGKSGDIKNIGSSINVSETRRVTRSSTKKAEKNNDDNKSEINKSGLHYNINVPWDIDDSGLPTVGDNEYIYIFERILVPIFKEYNPELVFISAGFDSAWGDPLGEISVSPYCYNYIIQRFMTMCNNKRIIVALEGGYNLKSISISAEYTLGGLLGESMLQQGNKLEIDLDYMRKKCRPNKLALDLAKELITIHGKKWKTLLDQQYIDYERSIKEYSKNYLETMDKLDYFNLINSSKHFPLFIKDKIYYKINEVTQQYIQKLYTNEHSLSINALTLEGEITLEESKHLSFLNPFKNMKNSSYWCFTMSIEDNNMEDNNEEYASLITTHKFIYKSKSGKIIESWDESIDYGLNYHFVMKKYNSHCLYILNRLILSNETKIKSTIKQLLDSFEIISNQLQNQDFVSIKILMMVDNLAEQTKVFLIDYEPFIDNSNNDEANGKNKKKSAKLSNEFNKLLNQIKSL